MWCTCLPLFGPCAPPSARGHVPHLLLLLPLCASHAALVAAHARPARVPCSPPLYPCSAALTPLPLPCPLSSTHHLSASEALVTRRGVACPSLSGYYCLLSLPMLYILLRSPLAGTTYAADGPTPPPEAGSTRRPLALSHQCGCASCGTTSPCGPRSLLLSTSEAGLVEPSDLRPPISPTAPVQHHQAGPPARAGKGGQPYSGAIMQSLGTDHENAG